MQSSLIDAGPVIALFDRDDQHHELVLAFIKDYKGRLITTWPVLTEISYMLDFNKQTQLDFISWIMAGGIEVINLEILHLQGVRKIMDDYRDLPADFADATLLVAADNMQISTVISLDKDFDIYRKSDGTVLQNILLR